MSLISSIGIWTEGGGRHYVCQVGRGFHGWGGRTAVSLAAQGAEACERHSEASGGRGSEEEDEEVI